MRYSALKEDINNIKNIQINYTDSLNEVLDCYATEIQDWANSIGCELINRTMKYSIEYIVNSYTGEMKKIINDEGLMPQSFIKVSEYCCASDVSIQDTKDLQDIVNSYLLNVKIPTLELKSKDKFDITDEKLEEFKRIVKFHIKRVSDLDENVDYKDVIENNVLATPLKSYLLTASSIMKGYFIDQNNIYDKYLDWLNKNKAKMQQLTDEMIEKCKNDSGKDFFNNQFAGALIGVTGATGVSALAFTKPTGITKSENNEAVGKNSDKKSNNSKKKNGFKIARGAIDTLGNALGIYGTVGDYIIPGTGVVGKAGAAICKFISGGLKQGEAYFGNANLTDGISKEKVQGQEDFINEPEIRDVLKLDVDMSDSERNAYYKQNAENIENVISKKIYNNQKYRYSFNMSDANLVKAGLAEHYEKVTGRNIANTPITFNPYINNVVNTQDKDKEKIKPELKVKKTQIDDLNKKIDENKDFNKINFEKLNKDIEEIKSKRFVYDPNKKESDKEPYDGLVPVNKDSEMHKLVEAISGLTDSIKAPNLLTSKGDRYNDETMSQLFEAIKRNNNINDAVKDFTNKSYGYSGYKDGTFDVNNYQDLNYALKNRIKFRPNNLYSQKLSKAKEFGSETGNVNIINLLKSAAKGIFNVGATLALSAISLPVGIVYGIGSIASAVATAPRDEYKDMLDNLGEETVDSFINNFEYNDEKNEYNCIN